MSKPTLLHGILIAFGLSALSLPLLAGLSELGRHALPTVIILLALLYLSYIFMTRSSRIGRATLGTVSFVALASAYTIGLSPLTIGMGVIILIWIVRSLLTYSSLVPTVFDGLLCALSGVCAVGAAILTGSIGITIWSFFLLQALAIYIPHSLIASQPTADSHDSKRHAQQDRFAQTHQVAKTALRQIIESQSAS